MPEGPASQILLSATRPVYTDTQLLPHPFDPQPASYAAQSHHVQPSSDIQDTPVLPMGPPTTTRKRKAPTLRREAWEPYQDRIKELHITQGLPLWEVKDTIEKEFGFTAEIRQYRTRISQWGWDKKVKPDEMKSIARKRQKRKLVETDKGELAFTVRGNPVASEKIDRWMKKNSISESTLYAPSPAASTPSAISCWTESEQGSPAPSLTYSASTPTFDAPSLGQGRHPSPPASSVSTVIRSGTSAFTRQSPAPISSIVDGSIFVQETPTAQPGSWPQYAPFYTPQMQIQQPFTGSIQYRYRHEDEVRFSQELSRLETLHGKDQPETLYSLSELGNVFMDQGRYKSAETLFQRLVNACQKWYDKNDTTTLKAFNVLGEVLCFQGSNLKAEKIHRRTLQSRRDVLGQKHTDTLVSMANLALTYWNQGRLQEAEELEIQVLEMRKQVLGEEHLDTLTTMSHLASTYQSQGRWQEAEELEIQVLEAKKRILGEEHPDTLTIIGDLVTTYWNQGRLRKAEELGIHVLEMRKRVLGEEHLHTITIMSHLASMYQSRERWQNAEELGIQVLEMRKRVLGEEHPDTLTTMCNLASTYQSQGQWQKAEELGIQVLETRKQVLGEEHLDILTTMSNLASTYQGQGRWQKAEELGILVLETRKRVLGEGHPHTLIAISNLITMYYVQGRWQKARELEKKLSKRVTSRYINYYEPSGVNVPESRIIAEG
ncbi:hypothetical protein GJ744_008584 [Endocarpon pusillum]|uniref:Clr5 domain-containing protein n=1 Tax=Endocarpon pusillum TaxID=364733 RepID=A0A8H7AGT6_9EURO|nr:hypothetical protein GJ744_008584 [Endocarpon pusillum]